MSIKNMKRLWLAVATFSLVEWIGRHTAIAGTLMLMGVGGGIIAANLVTPTIVPQVGAYFNQNQVFGNGLASALQPNGGTAGAFNVPTDVAGSWAVTFDAETDPRLGYGGAFEYLLGNAPSGNGNGLALFGNNNSKPFFSYKTFSFVSSVNVGAWWLAASALNGAAAPSMVAGTNYNGGLYSGTATGGGCQVEPTVVVQGAYPTNPGAPTVTSPGFNCTGWVGGVSAPASVSDVSMAGFGARQSTLATTTCAVVNSQTVVTANVAVAHGITPGMTYNLQGFSGGTWATLNGLTYTALTTTTGTTLVGHSSSLASCPTGTVVEGTALSGTGESVTFPAISTTNPWGNGGLGITTNNGRHICGVITENGDDSAFPGAAAISMVDEKGVALDGSPRLVQNLNQGAAFFNGYTVVGAQSPSTPALTVTSMIPFTISSASYNTGGSFPGSITFTMSAAMPVGFIPGSEFTVSGATPSSVNGSYVVLTGTSGTTVVGNPLSGPNGVLQALANPGAITFSSGQLVSVIMPGEFLLGANGFYASDISPYGTFGSTGTGADTTFPRTYGLTSNQTTFTFTGSISATGLLTAGSPGFQILAPNQNISWSTSNAGSATITQFTSGVGAAGTYATNWGGTAVGSQLMTVSGAMGSSGSPVGMMAFPAYYYKVGSSSGAVATATTLTKNAQSVYGDVVSPIGAAATTITPFTSRGWGGTIGNVGMLWGQFPMDAGGTPSATGLASLCKKTTTIPAYAAANSLTVHALYELNDIGIFGDSSWADFHGHTAGSTLTIDPVAGDGTPPAFSASYAIRFTGAGLPVGGVLATAGSAGGPYTLASSVGTISSEAMKAGAYAPATPIASTTAKGYIDGSNILHVTSFDDGSTHSGFASFTGSLTSEWTASVAATTGVMTVTGSPGQVLGVGTLIDPAPGTTAFPQGQMKVASLGTGTGAAGTYNVVTVSGGAAPTAAIASQLMDGSGPLPGGPTTLNVSTVTGTIAVGMSITDGGTSLTNQSLLITSGSGTKWTVNGNYYPAISADATMVGTLSKITPGEYIRNAALTTPVKVLAYQGACGITGAINGGLGCYSLSNNANGVQGSSGSPLTLVGTTITDGGVPAPGIALTIRDQGPGVTFPVTNYGSGTGILALSGTFDAPTLGGTPSAIQVLVSNTANGPPLSGCTPCNWGTLTGAITGTTWSGSISGIPAGGPYSISVRASNGTAYATLPSTIRVGIVQTVTGEGSVVGLVGSQLGGSWLSYYSGLWNQTGKSSSFPTGPSGSTGYIVTPLANDFLPTQTTGAAGDSFGPNGAVTGASLPEGMGAFEQTISNAFGGWPVAYIAEDRDGTSMIEWTTGNVIQTETIDVGDGTKKVWCSQASLCPGTSGGTVGRDGFLGFNMASLTGAWFQGSVATVSSVSTLTIGTYNGGAIEPGMILSGAGISGSPKVLYCVTCPVVTNSTGQAPNGGAPQSSTWVLDTNLGTVGSENMRLDPTSALIPFGLSSTPYPTFNYQGAGGNAGACCQIGGGYGAYLIKAGTFQITDNGTVVCQDTQTFAYNNTGGNCTGAGIASSFVNYQTGDYQISFSAAPLSGHVLTAQWVNIAAPESVNSAQFSRPQGQDFVGDGTSSSGSISNIEAKAPGGVSGRVYGGCSSDTTTGLLNGNGLVSAYKGYQFGGPGYSQQIAYLYSTKLPTIIPGSSASTPLIMQPYGRNEGAQAFNYPAIQQGAGLCPQLGMDMTTKSTFAGSITSNVLTLSADSVGPMWEGEVIGGGGLIGTSGSTATGVYITSLASGTWGKSGSTYNVSGMGVYNAANGGSSGTASGPFYNDVFYTPGTGIYGGTLNDLLVQANSSGALTGTATHELNGPTGGPRHGRRLAAMSYQGYLNPNVPNDPTVDRVKADATGCDTGALAAPCFDIGTSNAGHDAFPASHAATWSTGGNVFTVTGGLAAHDRPFVVGQAVACSSCNTGLIITSVSLPPSQDTSHANAGQVGNTFTFTVANGSGQAIGGSGSGTVTAGCSGTSGSSSNCIDIAFSINASGTFGTAKALATCGENNLNGNAPPFSIPNGKCQDNGIGTLVRTFRIGAQQQMSNLAAGSYFDDGSDLIGGNVTQSGAFTCNIVAAQVVQCVKTALLTGTFATAGTWTSGSTYVSYGDQAVVTGRQGGMLGPVGGQSLLITTPGTGYSSQTVLGSCTTIISGGWAPNFDVRASGGAIIGVYLASTGSTGGTHQAVGLGVNSSCTVSPTGGSGTASIQVIPLGGFEGQGMVANFNTDTNMTGTLLYGNEGFPGNPLGTAPTNFYGNGQGGYFEPGDAARPFGLFMGLSVSG